MSVMVLDEKDIAFMVEQARIVANASPLSFFQWGRRKLYYHASLQQRKDICHMLASVNLTAYYERYGDRVEMVEMVFDTETVLREWKFPSTVWRVCSIIKVVKTYEYQCAELDQWKDTEAALFCQSLKDQCHNLFPQYKDCSGSVSGGATGEDNGTRYVPDTPEEFADIHGMYDLDGYLSP